MSRNFQGEKSRCYICGRYLCKDDKVFLVQKAKVDNEYNNENRSISIYKNGASRFLSHEYCQNKMIWTMFNPNVEIDDKYYQYITLSYRNYQRIWKLGNKFIKDKCTQEELNESIAMFAKDLLNDKVKGF